MALAKKTKIAMTQKKHEALGAAKRGDRYKERSKKDKAELKKQVDEESRPWVKPRRRQR